MQHKLHFETTRQHSVVRILASKLFSNYLEISNKQGKPELMFGGGGPLDPPLHYASRQTLTFSHTILNNIFGGWGAFTQLTVPSR